MSLELPAVAHRSRLHLSSFHHCQQLFLQALTPFVTQQLYYGQPLIFSMPPQYQGFFPPEPCQRCLLERSKNNLRFSSLSCRPIYISYDADPYQIYILFRNYQSNHRPYS
ncbi:hypothetical protein B0H14DRAFT_3438330 [Mycena olivaceomarginata]|nr:hypothetical protein B0H14DRAFT_3438330 [Mycena olivaceomarginata]